MHVTGMLRVMLVILSLVIAGCSSPPPPEVDAARAAVDQAADSAKQYAAESVEAARAARNALEAELKVQEGKFLKSYDRTKELAAAAKAAGEKALADATAAKAKADADAARERVERAARAKAARKAPIRVGGQISPPAKIKNVEPIYPAVAKSARVEGTVVIEATVGADGKVEEAKVIKSVPLLDQAALDAVRQWEYTPTLLNGVPVPVVMTINVNFTRQ
jgi:TonB family protein